MKKSSPTVSFIKSRSGQKLLFFGIILYASIFIFSLISCARPTKDPLSYKKNEFSTKVSVKGAGIDFDAVFHIFPSGSFSAELISPESLAGLTLRRDENGFKIYLGDKEFLSSDSDLLSELSIGRISGMLAPSEPVRSISSVEGKECGMPGFEALTAVSAGNTVIYIDPSSSLPVKSECASSGISVTVLDFWFY